MSTDDMRGSTTSDTPPAAPPGGMQNFFDSLRRSPIRRGSDRWAGGVCAGLAERMGVDPVLVRVGVAVIAFLGGVPAILYGLAWLALPDRDGRIEAEAVVRGDVSPGAVVAGLLVLFGGLLPRPWQWWWPGADPDWGDSVVGTLVLLAVIVAAVVWLPRWQGAVSWRAAPSSTHEATGAGAGRQQGRGDTWARRPVQAYRRRGPGPVLTSAVLGVALLAGGAAALWTAQTGFDITRRLAALLAASAVLGLAMVWLGVVGRTDGAIGVAGVTALCFAVWFAVVPSTARIQTGDTTWAPTSSSSAEDGYVLLFGDGTVDLTGVRVRDQDVVVPVRLGVGSLDVTVPDDVPVTVRSRNLVGSTTDAAALPPGWTTAGQHSAVGADTTATSARDGDPRLVVDVQGLVGDISLEVAGR